MDLKKVESLIKNNEGMKMKKENSSNNIQNIVIESDKSTNKLRAIIKENNLKISLENEVGAPIEEYETNVVDSNDLVDKIKDAIDLYDMIDNLNIDFSDKESEGEDEEELEDLCIDYPEDMDAETGKEIPDKDVVADFDNDGDEEVLLNEETNSFSEIVEMMSNASSYDELYTAAGLIRDESLRTDVEQLIGQCEDDGDDVETAYSIVTSDLLDNKVDDMNECVKNESAIEDVPEEVEEIEDTTEDISIKDKLLGIQDRITEISKDLSDIANNSGDVEIMSIIMDLANSLSSDALDMEDAIETIEELDVDEDLEEVDEKDKTEEMLLRFRNNITESKLLAKKINNTNDIDKSIFEKYIKIVDEIL